MEKSVLFTWPFLEGLFTRLLAGAANLCRRTLAADADPRKAMNAGYREDVGGEMDDDTTATTSGK